MRLTHTEVCSETIGCDGDASSGMRGCVIGSLLQEFSPHMQMALKTHIHTHSPLLSELELPRQRRPCRDAIGSTWETCVEKCPVVKMIIFYVLEENRRDGMS